jgi:hypothetical protein
MWRGKPLVDRAKSVAHRTIFQIPHLTGVEDLFSGKQVKNRGELEKFLIPDYHPAIVSKELFLAANQSRQADF